MEHLSQLFSSFCSLLALSRILIVLPIFINFHYQIKNSRIVKASNQTTDFYVFTCISLCTQLKKRNKNLFTYFCANRATLQFETLRKYDKNPVWWIIPIIIKFSIDGKFSKRLIKNHFMINLWLMTSDFLVHSPDCDYWLFHNR